jgi:hypothetical protein
VKVIGIIVPLFAFIAVCLAGTLLERDRFRHGSPARVAESPEPIPWLPSDVVLTRNERTAWLVDVDGWYQFWNAGRHTLYYADGSYFAGDLNNRTAESPGGEWIVEGTAAGAPFKLRYALAWGSYPGLEAVRLPGGLGVPKRVEWLTRRCRSDRSECVVEYWWEVAP